MNRVVAALLVEPVNESLGEVALVPFQDRSLVIAGADLQKAIRVWCEKLRCLADHQVKIVAADVLGAELRRVRAPIPLALHRAEQITDVDDVGVALDCLLEVQSLECLIAMRVIVMPVAR